MKTTMMPKTTSNPESLKGALAKHQRHLFDEPKNVRRLVHGLVAACIVLVLLDGVVHRHLDHPWESLFGFYAFYGFTACVVLVLLAKEMRKLVMRAEDTYRPADGRHRARHGHGHGEDDD